MAFVVTDGAASRASPESPAGSDSFCFVFLTLYCLPPLFYLIFFFFYLWFDLFLAYLLFENEQLSNSSLICQSEASVISRKWGENEPFVLYRLNNNCIVQLCQYLKLSVILIKRTSHKPLHLIFLMLEIQILVQNYHLFSLQQFSIRSSKPSRVFCPTQLVNGWTWLDRKPDWISSLAGLD